MNKESKRVYEYHKLNNEKIQFLVKKGKREELKEYAIAKGYKHVATYIKDLIKKDSGIEL